MKRELVSIHMACNDPDNGDFAGHVCQIALPGNALELTAKDWNILGFRGCPKLREDGSHFVLSGKPWPFVRRVWWIGNWCWDGYAMTAENATAFLVWLHKRGLFHCEGGWCELCEAWDGSAPLVLPDRWWVR
jgi:hypothetical protein